jgi:hypothetical protein
VSPTAAAKAAERKRAAEAYDALVAARPLRPPPGRLAPPTMTAGAAQLAREIRAGTYTPARARLFGAGDET